jgi:glutaredoxin 3
MMADITIYTTEFCGFCRRAKALLDGKGADYKEIDVTYDPDKRAEMMARAQGLRTVPQIFISGQHVGGCEELYALERKGGLEPLLARA